jgi:hypothetical protein
MYNEKKKVKKSVSSEAENKRERDEDDENSSQDKNIRVKDRKKKREKSCLHCIARTLPCQSKTLIDVIRWTSSTLTRGERKKNTPRKSYSMFDGLYFTEKK